VTNWTEVTQKTRVRLVRNESCRFISKYLNNKGNHTILIIGDSHVRECAIKVKDKLDETYNVMGIVQPGANITTLSNSVRDTILTLGKNDIQYFGWGGPMMFQKTMLKKD
jgi:hypothetical protein